jgi:hypothetical protein
MDRCDERLGYSVWHADGTADYGAIYRGSGSGFIDFVLATHRESLLAHSHQVTNITLALTGDAAASESYVTAVLRGTREGRLLQTTVWGRYLDRWTRVAGRWGIAHREFIMDLDEMREVIPAAMEIRGRRDADDPSYGLLPADRFERV